MAAEHTKGREAREIFFQAVRVVIGNWPAVRLAVEEGYVGQYGREKERWLEEVVYNLFLENEIIDALDVEDYLAEILNTEFNVLIEDESLPKVCQTLCNYYQCCMSGDHSRVAAEIMSVQLPKLNARCDDVREDNGMDFNEHGMVAQQLQDLNLKEETGSCADFPQQTPSELNSMNDREEPEDGGGEWVVVQRSKKKH